MPIHGNAAVSYGNAWLQTRHQEPVPWLWDGLVALDAIILLSAAGKDGQDHAVEPVAGSPSRWWRAAGQNRARGTYHSL